MSRAERDKGAGGEREVVDLLHAHGFQLARRNFTSGSRGGGDVTGLPGFHVEVKRAERVSLPSWWRQASGEAPQGYVPLLALRWSRGDWLAVVPLDEMLALIARDLR